MPKVDREALRGFLEKNALNDAARKMIPHAMEVLEDLFLTAESGVYGSRAKKVTNEEITRAIISVAIGRQAKRVVPVRPFRSSGAIEKAYRKAVKDTLGDNPESSFRDSLWDSLGESLRDSLRDSLGYSLRDSLDFSLWDSLRESFGESLWESLRTSLLGSLFYYLGSILTGDKETSVRLEPLIRLLPSCVPLGEMKNEPGAWLCREFPPEFRI